MEVQTAILQYITTLGFGVAISALLTYKAAKTRGITLENFEEKLSNLTFETLRDQITDKLQSCFNIYCQAPEGVNFKLNGLKMKQVASQLCGDTNNLDLLHTIYIDLATQGVSSPYFLQALALVTT